MRINLFELLKERGIDLHKKSVTLDNLAQETWVAFRWLERIKPIKSINKIRGAYTLKHWVEDASIEDGGVGRSYVSEAAFIIAALLRGFDAQLDHKRVCFNFSEASLKEADPNRRKG